MRVQPRERVIRLFLGALLSSDLSEKELESAMSEICMDASFLLDLRLALRQSLRSLGDQRALSESVDEAECHCRSKTEFLTQFSADVCLKRQHAI